MKLLLNVYTLSIAIFSILLLPLPVASLEQAQQPAQVGIENVAEESSIVNDQKIDRLSGVTEVAKMAIQTAESSVEQMLNFLSVIGVLVIIIGGALTVLGVRSWRSMKKKINDKLQKQIDDLNVGVNKQHKIITEASWCMIFTTNAMHEWQIAANLSYADTNSDENERIMSDCMQKAAYNLDQAAFCAKEAGNITVEAWAYSMKAYICKRINNIADAIKNAETALLITINHIKEFDRNNKADNSYAKSLIEHLKDKLPSRNYNLACYYCLNNDRDKCMKYLTNAISGDPSYKNKAPLEKDLINLWKDQDFKILMK